MKHAPDYRRGNTTAAAIILAGDPQTFGAGLVQWAERWVASHPPKAQRWQRPAVAQRDGAQLTLGFGVTA